MTTHLNALDPLGEQQGAHAFRHRALVGINGAYDADPSVARQGWLKHTCEFGVAERDVIADMNSL